MGNSSGGSSTAADKASAASAFRGSSRDGSSPTSVGRAGRKGKDPRQRKGVDKKGK